MCFQDFLYYPCGHSKIVDTKCDEAKQLDVTYWQQYACPHYENRTLRVPYLCGAARFYCSHSADAPFLDHAFQIRVASQDTVNKVGSQLAVEYANVTNFVRHAEELQIPSHDWPNIPAHRQIKETIQVLRPKLKDAQQHFNEATAILRQAQHYFAQLAQQPASHTSNATPPFAPGPNALSKVPLEVQGASFGQRIGPVEDNNGRDARNLATEPENLAAMDANQKQASAQPSPGPIISNQAQLPIREPEGPNYRVLTYEEKHEVAIKAARRAEASMPKPKKRVAAEEETSPAKPKKKGRPSKKAKPSQEPASESEAIRRSNRVRDRKVDYAESPGSEERSPLKSEASGFSIEPSEAESSPDKAKQKRMDTKNMVAVTEEPTAVPRSSLLGAKIGDYQRRGGVAAGASSRQQNSTNPESVIRADSLQPSPSPSGLRDSPEFRSVRAPHGLSRPKIQPSKMLSSNNFAPGGPWQPPNMQHRPQSFTPAYASSPTMAQPRLPSEYQAMPNMYSSYSDPQYYQYGPASFQQQPTQGPSPSQFSMPQGLAGGSNVGMPQYGSLPMLENRMQSTSFDQPSAQEYPRDSPVLHSQGTNFQGSLPNQYDSMRHSFGTNVPDLTPPNVFTNSMSYGEPYGEPKKRKRPVTSPMLPNNERMQLPLPSESDFGNSEPEQPYDFGPSTQPAPFSMPQMTEYDTTSTGATHNFVNMRDLIASPNMQHPAPTAPLMTVPDFTNDISSAGLPTGETAAVEQQGTGLGLGLGEENDDIDPFGDLLDTGAAEWDLTE
ncbi:hypothetical protein KC331_g10278 [Hortaea werneckii]|nr:hypothetical protein KC331_g10278 [Hortaea werneckii]